MPTTLHREMGLSHAEFFRSLPAVVRGRDWRVDGAIVTIQEPEGPVVIRLSPQGERRIALIRLPVTQVTFEFPEHDSAAAAAFMRRFERHYQRGGG